MCSLFPSIWCDDVELETKKQPPCCPKPCERPIKKLKNGCFSKGLKGWVTVNETGSDPSAGWYPLTHLPTRVNQWVVPFPAPPHRLPYAFFETSFTGAPASSVMYQEIEIPQDKCVLAFDWYAYSGHSITALAEQPTMSFTDPVNFQFRVDLMSPCTKRSNRFFGPSTKGVVQNLIAPVINGSAQLDTTASVTLGGGFSRAFFDLQQHKCQRFLLAFRVVSAPCFQDALVVGIANVRFLKAVPSFTSGFELALNGRGSTTCPPS